MKSLKLLLKSQAGMSLMLALSAVGIVAGGSIYFLQNQQNASRLHSKVLINQNVSSITQVIQTILGKSANCTVTLEGISVGSEVPAIKVADSFGGIYDTDPDYFKPEGGEVFLKSDDEIGGRIKVEKIELINQTLTLPYLGNFESEAVDTIRITFRGDDLKAYGSTSMTRSFVIRGEKNGATYKSCYSEPMDFDKDVLKKSVNEACSSTFDSTPANLYCNWTALPACILTEPGKCSSKVYRYNTQVNVQRRTLTRMICTTRYKRHCAIGNPGSFTRTCNCTAPATQNTCDCSNGSAPSCFHVDWHKCENNHTYTSVPMDKCCRQNLPMAGL